MLAALRASLDKLMSRKDDLRVRRALRAMIWDNIPEPIMKIFGVMPAALVAISLAASSATASAQQQTLRVGERNSYKAQLAFLEPYKKGIDLAVEEVNAAGGVLGKKLEMV